MIGVAFSEQIVTRKTEGKSDQSLTAPDVFPAYSRKSATDPTMLDVAETILPCKMENPLPAYTRYTQVSVKTSSFLLKLGGASSGGLNGKPD